MIHVIRVEHHHLPFTNVFDKEPKLLIEGVGWWVFKNQTIIDVVKCIHSKLFKW